MNLNNMNQAETIQLHDQTVTAIGNRSLLGNFKTGLFCSRKCPADRIMDAHDQFKVWAQEERTIISGFHSPVEKECLRIFLKSSGSIILCPARGIGNMRIRAEWKQPITEGRFLIISPFDDKIRQPTARTAQKRNDFIVSLSNEVVVIHADLGSKLKNIVVEERLQAFYDSYPVNCRRQGKSRLKAAV